MGSQERLDKMQMRQNYRNLWHTDLMSTIQQDPPLDLVYHICSAKELFTMTCPDIRAVLDICLVVVGVVKVNVLNSAWLQRLSYALEILLPQLGFCCKMNSTYRRLNAIIALLVSCSASNKLLAFFLSLLALLEVMNSQRLLRFCHAWLIWCIARFVLVCRHNTRLKWTSEMVSLAHNRWQCHPSSKCHVSISHIHLLLDILPLLMGNQAIPLRLVAIRAIHLRLRLVAIPLQLRLAVTPLLAIRGNSLSYSIGDYPTNQSRNWDCMCMFDLDTIPFALILVVIYTYLIKMH